MPDRIDSLYVFARVAALGGLSAASRSLGISQSMATKHVMALEARLGVKLLHRTTRRTTLTEAGRRYLETVERILSELEAADAAVAAERSEVAGTLRLNAPVSFSVRVLAGVLADLSALHPGLSIDLGVNDRVVDLVDEGWDAAVRIGRIHDETLIARRLAPCRLMVAASPAYLSEHGIPRTVAALSEHNCLGYTFSRWIGPDRWSFGPGGLVAAVAGDFQANNGDVLLEAARAGRGIIYQPTFIIGDDLRAGRLVALSLDHPPMELDGVFAVYPGSRRPLAKVRALVDHLAAAFGPEPHWDRDLWPVIT
ncbi:LysR family transcriptional regulator [Methylobacterium sp. A54F]